MFRISKILDMAFPSAALRTGFAVLFLLLLTNVLSADISADELQKIKDAAPAKATVEPARPRKLLVFNLCEGYKHSSIPYWDKALEIMGSKTGAYTVEVSDDMSLFEPERLKQFDAVCFNNTTKLEFDPNRTPELCGALMDFVRGGKGIIGIHAATDNFYDWPQAQQMMGNIFTAHPWTANGTWAVKIDEPNHPLTAAFKGKGFKIRDEIYRTDPPLYSREKQLVLMSLDMSDERTRNVNGFKPTDEDTGISWVKNWGKGRVFYCGLGHNNEVTWNQPVLQHILDGIQFALGDLKVDFTHPRGGVDANSSTGSQKVATLQQLLEEVKTYQWGQSRLTLTEISNRVREAFGKKAQLKKIEVGLLDVLDSDSSDKSDATPAGKQFVCRQLSIIGTKRSVSTLTKMLTDEETSDMARYALERIPSSAVDEALRKALAETTGKVQVGIINSLGQRRDGKAVSVLGELIYDSDAMVAESAASALGKIAGSKAIEVLAEAKGKTAGSLQMEVLDAYLKCADKLAIQNEKTRALDIYKELQQKEYPEPIRQAALRGLLDVSKKG